MEAIRTTDKSRFDLHKHAPHATDLLHLLPQSQLSLVRQKKCQRKLYNDHVLGNICGTIILKIGLEKYNRNFVTSQFIVETMSTDNK